VTIHRVRAHGITLDIDVAVPGWRIDRSPGVDPWTVSIRVGSPTMRLGPQPRPGRVTWTWDDSDWPRKVSVDIHGGPAPGSTRYVVDRVDRRVDVEGTAAVGVLGCLEILGKWILPDLARHDLGAVPLHATAVMTSVGAVLVAGESGHGKSSLTAALCAAGAHLVGDEPACVVPTTERSMLLPGIGLLRLDEMSARRLDLDRTSRWSDVSGGGDESGKLLLADVGGHTGSDRDGADPVVAAIVVLGPRRSAGPLLAVEAMAPTAAFRTLFAQRYTRVFHERSVRHDFVALAALTSSTPVLAVELVDDLTVLPDAAHRLLDEVVDVRS
jgi:hypothetical protein